MEPKSPKTLTTGELISLLAQFDENTPVLVSYPYGDYWHNTAADEISESEVELREVCYSNYYRTYVVRKDDEDDEDDEDADEYVHVLTLGK